MLYFFNYIWDRIKFVLLNDEFFIILVIKNML